MQQTFAVFQSTVSVSDVRRRLHSAVACMPPRLWLIFAALVLARIANGLQTMSAGAVGPDIMAAMDIGFAALGTLIGVYSLPGTVLAFPGGWFAARFGDRTILLVGLGLLTLGGAVMTAAPGYTELLAGRLLAGTGSALLAVVQSKLVMQYVPKPLLAVLMGTYIAGHGVGCALAPSVLPLLGSWQLAMAACAVLCAVCLVVSMVTIPARQAAADPAAGAFLLKRGTLPRLLMASGMWSLSNAGYIVVFSFLPAFFVGTGMPLAQASGLSSLGLYACTLPMPLGGWLLARTTGLYRGAVASLVGVTALIAILPLGVDPIPVLIAIGALVGVCAGPAFTIATETLEPEERALAMAIFFSIYNIVMTAGPAIAGWARDLTQCAEMPFFVAAIYMGLAALCLAAHKARP